MSYAQYIKEIGRGQHGARDLSVEDAQTLFSAMLDGGVPDLELGAIVLALRVKTEALSELTGFYQAAAARVYALRRPAGHIRPIVIPTYNGARKLPNLLPLLALLLQRFGVPVLLHGTLEGNGRVATAYILRELGVMPCVSLAAAQTALDEEGLAFVPTGVVSPGLANLMALRNRLGVRNSAHTIVKLIDPFDGGGVPLVSVTHPDYLQKMQAFFGTTGLAALLMRGTEGEPFANPRRRPKIEYFEGGNAQVLFEAEAARVETLAGLPESLDPGHTAAWIKLALAGKASIPYPIVNQLACCLRASGYTADMNQAKAIAAVETGSMAA